MAETAEIKDLKNTKFYYWRARPHLPRKTISSDPKVMETLIDLANKGVRARIKATVESFAEKEGMSRHVTTSFSIVDNQIRFKCSDEFGEAFKKAHPRLNVIREAQPA